MLKYAQILDEETKVCAIANFDEPEKLKKYGFEEMDVEQAYNGNWYVSGYAPEKPAPTHEEQRENRANAYQIEVDPITSHISRLKDEEQTPEIEQEIEDLKQERSEKIEEIKERYPYPEE